MNKKNNFHNENLDNDNFDNDNLDNDNLDIDDENLDIDDENLDNDNFWRSRLIDMVMLYELIMLSHSREFKKDLKRSLQILQYHMLEMEDRNPSPRNDIFISEMMMKLPVCVRMNEFRKNIIELIKSLDLEVRETRQKEGKNDSTNENDEDDPEGGSKGTKKKKTDPDDPKGGGCTHDSTNETNPEGGSTHDSTNENGHHDHHANFSDSKDSTDHYPYHPNHYHASTDHSASSNDSTNKTNDRTNERDPHGDPQEDQDTSLNESTNDRKIHPYKHLWIRCENEECLQLNYKKYAKERIYTCESCGVPLKISSSDRIEILIDPGTWKPMDKDMFARDPIEWDLDSVPEPKPEMQIAINELYAQLEEFNRSLDQRIKERETIENHGLQEEPDPTKEETDTKEEPYPTKTKEETDSQEEPEIIDEPYLERLDYYKKETGLREAVQTGTGQINGIPVAIAIMDFNFLGGTMGSVVGEKITRLVECATNQRLPLIIVCASGGARMQEGSLSLIQMAKISSSLYQFQINQKLFYAAVLTSPTTGGVTASFGMLGDVILAEPEAYIAFAGKRVIEDLFKVEVPEGSQSAEALLEAGMLDFIVPRNPLKAGLTELLELHGFLPKNQKESGESGS